MSGAPITFKGQHALNALLLLSIVVLTFYLCSTQSSNLFWILVAVSFLIGFLIIIPNWGQICQLSSQCLIHTLVGLQQELVLL